MRAKLLGKEFEILHSYSTDLKTARDIARNYGVSDATILRLLKSHGVEIRHFPGDFGSGHNCWKGGRTLTGDGYLRVWVDINDPMSSMRDKKGYVLEHRLTMARVIGRPLTRKETVHHIDGDRLNNVIGNLQLRSSSHGPGQVRVCGDCGSKNIVNEEL